MQSVDEYLRGEFAADGQEITKVQTIAAEVLNKTLRSFHVDGSWPYEISNGPNAPEPPETPSHSTAAMILFAMGVAQGDIRDSLLAPQVSLGQRRADPVLSLINPDDRQAHRQDVVTGLARLHSLIESSKERLANHTFHVSWSDTYGADDPFTMLWLLELLRVYDRDGDELARWRDDVIEVAWSRVTSVLTKGQVSLQTDDAVVGHLFPKLRWIQTYVSLCRDRKSQRDIDIDVPRIVHDLEDRLHQHLSYFDIPDSTYDAAELAFAMEGILLLDDSALTSATVERCWQVLHESQRSTPCWRPLRPFIANSRGLALMPLSVELANSIIRSCRHLEGRGLPHDHLGNAAELLRKYSRWLYARNVNGFAAKKPFVGWHSEYIDDPHKIHTWETSQVLVYLLQHAALLESNRALRSLSLLNPTIERPDTNSEGAWKGLWDHLIESEAKDWLGEHTVYSGIDSAFVAPRAASLASEDGSNQKYSMLLYGPPGTGKSWIAKILAFRLGFPLVTITPNDFQAEGAERLSACAKTIFEVLTVQSNMVILFDEIDRLITDRTSEGHTKQSDAFQSMTNSMLKNFDTLRDRGGPIFVLATNHAERIDPAIRRPPRIDEQYLVLPPNTAGRLRIIREIAKGLTPASLDSLTQRRLKSALQRTVLGGPLEIVRLVEQAVRDMRRSANGDDLMASINSTAVLFEPIIRLANYQSAIDGKVGYDPPFEEYLMLMYLVLESGHFSNWKRESADCKLWESFRERFAKALLSEHITDRKALAVLEDAWDRP